MKPVKDNYPVFEANQVLTNIHLNDIFSYLDEQERLTRANLIGIGIVCGLEIRHETIGDRITVHITKGCGITSEGYLIVESEDVPLVSYRRYTLPADLDYSLFEDIELWEMFPASELGTTSLNDPSDFLNDKVVVLFLELKKEKLRNCSPINCDDKGAQVTAMVRRLLIKRDALKDIITEANQLGANLTFAELEAAMLARLNLPDLRLPRLGIPNRDLATSNDVFAAFLSVFQVDDLVSKTGDALRIAYHAFRPVVKEEYPSDPFTPVFEGKFGFLTTAPKETSQVRFLQYYYDFFDDLIKAYDEFRWKGVELMCVCCPPEGLFPRHLMLGELYPEAATSPGIYRHSFLASSGIGGCDERIKDLKLLFQRLVEMIIQFTDIRRNILEALTDTEIRITPSQLGDVPLGNKAIPYYYQQNGSPPLYHLWNAEKNRRNRANQNLSYRSYEYENPAEVPAFVRDALRYDLEPYNFLRIEGHLGKDYRSVLYNLLSLKSAYRLPIEIIALRTGVFDDKIPVDLDKEKCRFQDLEALYDALREELIGALCEGVMYLYDIPTSTVTTKNKVPELALLKEYAKNFRFAENTVGAWCERHLSSLQEEPYIEVDQKNINPTAVLVVFCRLFPTVDRPNEEYFPHIVSIYYLFKLFQALPTNLSALHYADFENKQQDLIGLVRYFRTLQEKDIDKEFKKYIPKEDLIDHFDHVLFSCRLEPIKAVHEEYVQRLREIKQKQFLSFFLQSNPGIQHKAGVPLGGTFIIVYHEDTEAVSVPPIVSIGNLSVAPNPPTTNVIVNRLANSQDFSNTVSQINNIDPALWSNNVVFNSAEFGNQDIYALFRQWLIEQGINLSTGSEASQIINQTVNGLADGTVIADFFLPYLCCSDCSPVQYVLPTPPLGVDVRIGCTDERDQADITITPGEGTAPFTYQLDGKESEGLPAGGITIKKGIGDYTLIVRDAAGRESAPQLLSVMAMLKIVVDEEHLHNNVVSVRDGFWRVECEIIGGRGRYSTSDDGATIEYRDRKAFYLSNEVEDKRGLGQFTIEITITDEAGCSINRKLTRSIIG